MITVECGTLIGNLVLEIKPSGQHDHTPTRSGQNVQVLEAKKYALSVSQRPSETEPWLLINANRKP